MPFYRGKPCVGFCERFGRRCLCPDLYVDTAEQFNALPTLERRYLSRDLKRFREVWVLRVPEWRRNEACAVLQPGLLDEGDGAFWLAELPCHSKCEIVICIYCGSQHRGCCDCQPSKRG